MSQVRLVTAAGAVLMAIGHTRRHHAWTTTQLAEATGYSREACRQGCKALAHIGLAAVVGGGTTADGAHVATEWAITQAGRAALSELRRRIMRGGSR